MSSVFIFNLPFFDIFSLLRGLPHGSSSIFARSESAWVWLLTHSHERAVQKVGPSFGRVGDLPQYCGWYGNFGGRVTIGNYKKTLSIMGLQWDVYHHYIYIYTYIYIYINNGIRMGCVPSKWCRISSIHSIITLFYQEKKTKMVGLQGRR